MVGSIAKSGVFMKNFLIMVDVAKKENVAFI